MNEHLVTHLVDEIARITGLSADEIKGYVETPPRPEMGDFALPCFKLAKSMRKPPKAIAEDLAKKLKPGKGIARIEAAAGYLNIFLDKAAVTTGVLEKVLAEAYGKVAKKAAAPVVVEYSSPNIAKPFGVGHLRSTVIGNSIARLYETAGYQVVRLNYPGDWGTQFGMLLALWTEEGRGDPAQADIKEVLDVYVRANKLDESDEGFAKRAREYFKKLEEGDHSAKGLWESFRKKSLGEFQRVYDILGVDAFDASDGEASIAMHPEKVEYAVQEASKRGLAVRSEGALVVDLSAYDMPPLMLRKTDGTSTYHTRDLATIMERWEKHKFEKIFYVVGQDQKLHFKQLFKTVELMGFDWASRCIHVDFGMIRFGGGKMSTRGGNVVFLEDLLADVVNEVRGIVAENNPELDGAAAEDISRKVATGAIVFEDLRRKRIKDVEFDRERALSLTGDTGPYLQYSHARLAGILRKAREAGVDWRGYDPTQLKAPEETALIDKLGQFEEQASRATEQTEPSIVAGYLLELAGEFNGFYVACKVIGVEKTVEKARLALVEATKRVLKQGLYLLGIGAPERM